MCVNEHCVLCLTIRQACTCRESAEEAAGDPEMEKNHMLFTTSVVLNWSRFGGFKERTQTTVPRQSVKPTVVDVSSYAPI